MAFDFKKFGQTPETSLDTYTKADTKSGSFDFNSFGKTNGTEIPDNTSSGMIVQNKQEKKGVLNKVGDFLGIEKFGQGVGVAASNITGGTKPIEEALNTSMDVEKRVLEAIKEKQTKGEDISKLAKTLSDLTSSRATALADLEEAGTGGLTNKEVIGSALNTALLAVPVGEGAGAVTKGLNNAGIVKGASIAGKFAEGAGIGYGYDVAKNLQDNKEGADIVKPGMGTLIGGALPILGKITGLDKGVAGATKSGASKLEEINQRLTPVDKQNLERKGKDIAGFLAQKRIVGTPETRYLKVSSLYDDMENKVTSAIANSKKAYKKTDLVSEILKIPENFIDDPVAYEEAVSKTEKIASFIQEKAPDNITAPLLNKYKRNLFKRAYAKNNTDVTNETFHSVASLFKGKLDKIPEVLPLNKEYSNIIDAKKILFKAKSRSQTGLIGKAAGLVGGSAIGGSIGGGVGATVGAYAGPQVAEQLSTPLRSATGAGLQTISDIVNKIPTDKAGNLKMSKKVFMSLIQQIRNY